jgi:aspartyl-tRNA synthetase
MGKLKEKLLNNLSEQEMEDMFGISAFEYTELMAKYGEDENYIPTESEIEDIEKLVEDYYKSKEFSDYVEEIDIDEINDSLARNFTEDEIIEAIRKWKNEDWFIDRIKAELDRIWNRKRGF